MLGVLLAAATLASASLASASPAAAQQGPRIDITLPAQGALLREGPTIRGSGLLADAQLRDLVRNGFPARFSFRVELWSTGGFFNSLEASTTWDVIVRYDPLEKVYEVVRIAGAQAVALGRFPDVNAAGDAVGRPVRVPLNAPSRSRYYYAATLDVEVLSLSDLDELERWLRGELRPAVSGRRNPGTALTRGVRTLVVRLLGGTKRHFEAKTGTFKP
ncbi:MAG TPA: DUF4390 domain-containing protein [Gemmatimonadaceae bacterium]|nr:DUF4390 domain-containing protein [Gemmatimonadaceae bacterium]